MGGEAKNKTAAVWEDGDYEAVIPRARREREKRCNDANFASAVTVSSVDSRTVGRLSTPCARPADDSPFKRRRARAKFNVAALQRETTLAGGFAFVSGAVGEGYRFGERQPNRRASTREEAWKRASKRVCHARPYR